MDRSVSDRESQQFYQGPPILPRPTEDAETHGSSGVSSSRHPPRIHHRSCTECSRRKVRCNHHQPCSNCVKAGSECIFPTSRRTPRRLQSTEIAQLVAQGEADDNGDEGNCSEERIRQDEEAGSHQISLFEESARLMLDHDRSRYISNHFWASMSREIDEMRDILDGSSSEQENDDQEHQDQGSEATPSSRLSHNSRDFPIFSPSATSQSLQSLYPSSSDLLTIFDVFQENVDPVVHIFHRPTMRKTITEVLPVLDRSSMDRMTEVVVFSICYAALTSLNDADCQKLLGEERRVLLSRYRYATEQSLSRARFLESQNLGILAALILFLLCLRRHDDSRLVSSLLGVVIRNAQAVGLHRDGTKFNLSPYETEWRRRLWWHICVLDIRAAEDHGCDPSIYDQNYDTRFPLNINDDDLSPEATVAPPERQGVTDMTFCLLRFEVAVAIRKLNYHGPVGNQEPALSTVEKRDFVERIEKRFYERYINCCDITKPFDWVSAAWARLMLSKMWLAVSNPLHLQDTADGAASLSLRRVAFERSVEMLELADSLETGHRAARWRWLFMTHVQWHAVVFVLAYLCVHPTDELSHRAWLVMDRVCERWPHDSRSKKGMLWKPIHRLMDRAQQIRGGQGGNPPKEPGVFEESHHQSYHNPPPGAPSQTRDLAIPLTEFEPMTQSTDLARENAAPSVPPTCQGTDEAEHHLTTSIGLADSSSTPNFGVSVQAPGIDGLQDLQDHQSDWANILHELQHGFQEDPYADMTDPTEAINEYGNNLWGML
ncbi:fungal specific transcription factor domain-containing protein [Trichoderma breve]|uniref:Fungal specific transcription factor domain-containing protein n=1 Tax=Trichoderma breve TaxID=2034170 RepID=A0A9W9BCW8_9HYPO|nr:fungal specific transcription factor domain-containing protein [Trichoderma breve]KAJ4858045.1 fungal specific transcription factor domain-containing protein [Trichoderma breve]